MLNDLDPAPKPPTDKALLLALVFAAASLLILLDLASSASPIVRTQAIQSGQLYLVDLNNHAIIGRDTPPKRNIATQKAHPKATPVEPEKPKAEESKPSVTKVDKKEPPKVVTEEAPAQDAPKAIKKTERKPAPPKMVTPTETAPVNKKLLEKTKEGNLPIISKQGLTPSEAYAVPYERPTGRAILSIMIIDAGLQERVTQQVAALPKEISAGIMSYAPKASKAASDLRLSGREVWLSIPAQDASYPATDPGYRALLLGGDKVTLTQHLRQTLGAMQGYVGTYLAPTEVVSSDSKILSLISDEMVKRGLLLLVSNTESRFSPSKKTPSIAIADAYLGTTVVEPVEISRQLLIAEEKLKENGSLILVVQASHLNIDAIEQWLPTLNAKAIALAPLSSFYRN